MDKHEIPPVDEAQLATLPQWAADLIRLLIAENKKLKERIEVLEAKLRQNSSNSSRPPSTDGFQKPRPWRKTKSNGKPGGQPGHEKKERPRLEPTEVHEVVPETCAHCGEGLTGKDPQPQCHQWMEIPEIRPTVIEYRLHSLECPRCGKTTKTEPPVEHQASYGPKVHAFIGQAISVFRFSRRKLSQILREWLGLPIATGTICKMQKVITAAVGPAMREIEDSISNSGKPVNVDETSFRLKDGRGWLWHAGNQEASLFQFDNHRNSEAAETVLGDHNGIIITDRYSAYSSWEGDKRQFCWSHLLRDFEAVRQDGNETSSIGKILVDLGIRILKQWAKVRDGTMTRIEFQTRYLPRIRSEVRMWLEKGLTYHPMRIGVLAKQLLDDWKSLWLFAEVEGVEPTNNEAERQLRELVIYRKISLGVKSDYGAQFLGAMHSVVSTCAKQGKKVLDFLSDTIRAFLNKTPSPKLLTQ